MPYARNVASPLGCIAQEKENDMGVFESRDYGEMLEELRRLFGADDRITGMIPDTYGDPGEMGSYGKQYLDTLANYELPNVSEIIENGRNAFERPELKWNYTVGADDRVTGMIPDTYGDPSEMNSYGSQSWDALVSNTRQKFEAMPRTSEIIDSVQEMGKAMLYDPKNVWDSVADGYTRASESTPYIDKDAEGAWKITKPPFNPYKTEDGSLRFGLDDQTAPNRISIDRLIESGGRVLTDGSMYDLVRDNFDRVKNTPVRSIIKNIKDRQNQRKEDLLTARDRLTKGLMLAEDNESFIDRQTRLPDGTVGSEEKARGYKAEGARELVRGIGYGAADVPDSILGLALDEDNVLRAPTQAVKRALQYEETGDEAVDSALSAMHSLGRGIGETVGTGVGAGLMNAGIRRLAHRVPRELLLRDLDFMPYSWKNATRPIPHVEDFLNTRLGSDILDLTSEGIIDLAMIRQIAQKENWSSEEFEAAAQAAVGLALLGQFAMSQPRRQWDPVRVNDPNMFKRVLTPEEEKEAFNPFVPNLDRVNGEVQKDEFNNPKYITTEQQVNKQTGKLAPKSPNPHQIGKVWTPGGTKLVRKSDGKKQAENAENLRSIVDVNNEEIDTYGDRSLTPSEKHVWKLKGWENPEVPKNPPLKPDDSLILGNELKRVFGKYSLVEEAGKNKFNITLPNGVELKAQVQREVVPPTEKRSKIRQDYDLPRRTLFKLKGDMGQIDSHSLMQLSTLHDIDTVQHEAIHFALKTVTTRKEKKVLQELFGDSEEKQVAGVMEAIAKERVGQAMHPGPFFNKLLRKIEKFGGYLKSYAQNVPMAIAKRDLSYLEGRSPQETLRDYAESFVDGSVWGRELSPVMKELLEKRRDELETALTKEHSRLFIERNRLAFMDRSPNIFSILPHGNHPFLIDPSIINKVLLEKHADSISPEHLARLPEALEDPILIIESTQNLKDKKRAAGKKSPKNKKREVEDIPQREYNFLLDMNDKKGVNIFVPIGFGYGMNQGMANKVKSVYGYGAKDKSAFKNRPDMEGIINMIKSKNLQYINRDKALELFRKHFPEKYYDIRDYLDNRLPAHVYTPETYRAWRNKRGLKPMSEELPIYFE